MFSNSDVPQVTRTEHLILSLLISKGKKEQYGLEMVNTSQGSLKKGTIYVLLQRLEEKGFISSRKEPRQDGARGLPKRLYKITSEGQKAKSQFVEYMLSPPFLLERGNA